jgi:hypothetical protein
MGIPAGPDVEKAETADYGVTVTVTDNCEVKPAGLITVRRKTVVELSTPVLFGTPFTIPPIF